jgi:hypothetical protein
MENLEKLLFSCPAKIDILWVLPSLQKRGQTIVIF